MKKFLIILISFFLGASITSCAVQTNVIKSLEVAKKSVLKIETKQEVVKPEPEPIVEEVVVAAKPEPIVEKPVPKVTKKAPVKRKTTTKRKVTKKSTTKRTKRTTVKKDK